ncbi:sensor domain-containing diguanylate cyclase [Marinobacter orientalis]|uniref:Sensor domain-containing diguanylate cyclase n=1 Tax=Marinobacter orientalis TaxID=1928859 RepID=A0A7Y0WT45_9GAMM|nr:sensor domain-containing diguanylate cyclase [Marinobacter orientalis]NMT64390.1 sensor domain-containing diguanylate cyclase [Marinobacter orientalis]TGX50641.1 sensor domain-containing diguanylate cyclase [Marinobacter orientalis]
MDYSEPLNEAARVQQLRSLNILDTKPEERFDRLTRLAKRLFSVPVALVSLVDSDRLWLKSKIGMTVCEVPRSVSFCGHAILKNDAFVVPNLALDERFAENELVTGSQHLRFYAGYPIRNLEGSPLGTLCIIDYEPREFSDEDAAALRDLAELAESELIATQMAIEDELTHLPNRRGFLYQAQNTVNLCYRLSKPASLVFLDLTRFKQINDTFGHEEGDLALKAFANVLRQIARESDLPARLGGDEFVILLTDTPSAEAHDFIYRLRQALDIFNAQAQRGYEIAFNQGIVELDLEREHEISALLKQADALMYEHKSSGRPHS